ncbi:MAG TPA: hypothetical protein VFS24_18630, partial [Steroidobacteraceae bacterium]|nr:hypothetical protein [Steroidobacteraceae bacterium]
KHYPYPQNVPLIEVTPLWEPALDLMAGLIFVSAVVLILRRSRMALGAVVAPFVITLLLFLIRFGRTESGYAESLSAAYQRSHWAMVWPMVGLAIMIVICLALWNDKRPPLPR